MSKIVKTSDEARLGIRKGINLVADIVKTTVGPKGRNILIRNNLDTPIITNDGATIAKSIELKDNIENAGAALMISAANKTNEIAGDGTTSTTILTQSMIDEYFKMIDNGDISLKDNVVVIQNNMINMANIISQYLQEISTLVEDEEDILKIATVSGGSEEIGNLITQAFTSIDEFGSVIVEDSKTGLDEVEVIDGMRIPNGSISPYLLNDRVNQITELYDANILLVEDKIDDQVQLLPIFDKFIKNNTKILIIAEDFSYECLNFILANKAQGIPLNISIIKTPGFGNLKEDIMMDLSIATGAKIISREKGITLEMFDMNMLGKAKSISITNNETIIKFVDDEEIQKAKTERAKEIFNKIEDINIADKDKESLRRRLSNINGGMAVLKVGGNSDVEINDKKLRIEDAINSVNAAKESGYVPGGGYSFLRAYSQFNDIGLNKGSKIVINALPSITRQIAKNAGETEDVVSKCLETRMGYNALNGNYENLVESGIINSLKVDKYSLLNATSVASTMITMGGLIIDENEPEHNVLRIEKDKLIT